MMVAVGLMLVCPMASSNAGPGLMLVCSMASSKKPIMSNGLYPCCFGKKLFAFEKNM
jgi:hypothetical protein